MTSWDEIESRISAKDATPAELLAVGEAILENWVEAARQDVPTQDEKEGFRLLALHAQGAKGEPSFHACRETCRELAWHYNLLKDGGPEAGSADRLRMMTMVVTHLMLFIRGKMEVAELGDFCCSSKSTRTADSAITHGEARG